MLTVQHDWIQYEALPARRVAVRGGAACAQRVPTVRERAPRPSPSRTATTAGRPAAVASKWASNRRLRLTRRGRIVLVVLPALLLLSGALMASGAGRAEAVPLVRPGTVVVGTGDSLWSIAERIEPGSDPRGVVVALQRANGLQDATVHPGAVLRLPAVR